MTSFVDIPNGKTPAAAVDIQQIIDALKGTSGKGVAIALTAVNDAIAYALSVKNLDATNSRAVALYGADGNPLLTIDKNGVQASAYGANALAPVVTTSATQALSNKTLTAPVITSPSISGGAFGAGTAWVPGLNQSGAITVTVEYATYIEIGKLVLVQFHVTATTGGGGATELTVTSWPVAPRITSGTPSPVYGRALYRPAATGANNDLVLIGAGVGNTARFIANGATASYSTLVAIGDAIAGFAIYEAA